MPRPNLRLVIRLVVVLSLFRGSMLASEDPAWLGAWQEESDPNDIMVFERDRCSFQVPERIWYGCAAYSPSGDVWMRLGLRRLQMQVKVTGDRLEIVKGGRGTYRRLAAAPPSFEPTPLQIPAAIPVQTERRQAIVAEAAKRLQEDQNFHAAPEQRKEAFEADTANAAWAKDVIVEVGWTDAARFGKATVTAMTVFLQHGDDLPLMLGVLPRLEAEARSKACDPQDYALLFDRIQMDSGRPQRYGTQIIDDLGRQKVFLLEDKAKVDQFRAAIGLPALKTSIKAIEEKVGKIGFVDQIRFDN